MSFSASGKVVPCYKTRYEFLSERHMHDKRPGHSFLRDQFFAAALALFWLAIHALMR